MARGIARLLHAPPPPLADYVAAVEAAGLYPGSPVIARALLRPADRLLCCELHPEDAAALRRTFAGDAQVAVHARDGWDALRALLPPPARRGLVLIDPPYEAPGERARLAQALATVAARFPGAIVAGWYPIKHRAPVRALHEAVAGVRDVVAAELWLREPTDPARLNGNGLLVRNPPFAGRRHGRRCSPPCWTGWATAKPAKAGTWGVSRRSSYTPSWRTAAAKAARSVGLPSVGAALNWSSTIHGS